MKAAVVGPVERWLSEEMPHFPYNKTFGEAEWNPLVVLHTSGSVGILLDKLAERADWEATCCSKRNYLAEEPHICVVGRICGMV